MGNVLHIVFTIFVGHQTASPAPFVKFTWQNVLRMTTSFSVRSQTFLAEGSRIVAGLLYIWKLVRLPAVGRFYETFDFSSV